MASRSGLLFLLTMWSASSMSRVARVASMMRKIDEGVIEPARTGLGVRLSTHSSRVDLPEPLNLAPNAETRRDVDAEIRARQQVHIGAPEHRRRQPVQRGDDVAREFREGGVEHRADVRDRFEPGLVVVGDRRDFRASRRLGPALAGRGAQLGLDRRIGRWDMYVDLNQRFIRYCFYEEKDANAFRLRFVAGTIKAAS